MAEPIKETPVLKDDEARAFEKIMKDNEDRAVSEQELEQIQSAYSSIKNNTGYSFR